VEVAEMHLKDKNSVEDYVGIQDAFGDGEDLTSKLSPRKTALFEKMQFLKY
jgi:hypothetical protein